MSAVWRNWSATARCEPARLVRPSDEEQIVRAVALAARQDLPVRVAGTGHSFNRLVTTNGLLLDLTRYAGVLGIDRERHTVTVRAGTRLGGLCRALDAAGLALPNVGTLGEQTVAGAVSTGNHGSGIAHPPLSGDVLALRLVTADGQVRELDRDTAPELFRCARTGLGALGVITAVTFRCVPAFNLRVRESAEPLDAVLERFVDWAAGADHASLSWLPWTDRAGIREQWRTDAPVSPGASARGYRTTLDEVRCGLLGLAGQVAPGIVPWANRPSDGGGEPVEYVGRSHQVFTFPQPVRFLALEHALSLEQVPAAIRHLRGALRGGGRYSPYSVLVRVGGGDDAPLSPAYGRATGYINLTVPRTAAYLELLRIVEHVLREHGARPHWGKAHTATAEVLAPRYPEWSTFQRIRAQVDPDGRFTNDYLDRVIGPVGRPDRGRVGAATSEGH
ncbi:L-gulonolactone oxidase [Amycolatopsis xylanica]|uniref:L-gulonolactone oxidase n=1 Tax=Amycolatopsis xylanica TaxID=589385 RepID=A0A1H3EYM9_9PSEU|nr:D-arabinono-1,4-lactone oxidase [Amycolatopsis xylanica]SDX83168.1 L-gulonolactone oxidase [Amycolatopsis xylanica]